MTDRRRSQWIAFDSMFFGNELAVDILDRFGTAGVTVWLAYLCACKRNLVPGQISYLTDADCLAQLGLSGVELRDATGAELDLNAFWTRLGQLKNVSRRRRGHVTDLRCTRWEEWQQSYGKERQAAQKARSRLGNTETKPGRSEDDPGTDRDIDRDRDTDQDKTYTPAADHTPTHPDDPLLPTGFDAFWSRWPPDRRIQRSLANQAWRAARANGTSEVEILQGVDAWATFWTASATDPQFIPNPANWLKRSQWQDDPPTPATTNGSRKAHDIETAITSFIGAQP